VTVTTKPSRVDADHLVKRVEALAEFLDGVHGAVPEARLARARQVVDKAGKRLALSRDHTVVALAGATGSGKSSLFNAIAKLQLSQVGVRRPTTGLAHVCVWGTDRAKPLLDWLGVPSGRRFSRESALDGDDEAGLRGMVLVDLPDFDSVHEAHRVEVDRFLELVDLVVWVLDPQKYADRVVHEQYLTQFKRHRDITVVVLNQADLLRPGDSERVVADLRRLLVADGLGDVPVLVTSTVAAPGTSALRSALEYGVSSRQGLLRRLTADVRAVGDDLAPLVSVPAGEGDLDRQSIRRLSDALSDAAGVPAVVEATEQAYRHRAGKAMGWPLLRWFRRMRPDPLRRLHLPGARQAEVTPASSLPPSTAAEKAAVALAGRTVADRAASSHDSGGVRALPDPWPAALLAAARSRLNDVPDALDLAVTRTDLGLAEHRLWWRAVGVVQWVATAVALVGLAWLGVRLLWAALALPDLPAPTYGVVPLPTAMLVGGLLFGLLLSVLVRPLVNAGARRARRSADKKLRNAVANVATEMIVEPVRGVLRSYGRAQKSLALVRKN
jgi:GTP-binding protein EngB required for normal cell division